MLGKVQGRQCNVVGEEYFGVKLPNGTWTGALGLLINLIYLLNLNTWTGLLQSGKAHLYLKGEPHFIDEEWLQKSLPLRAENLWAGQLLEDENKLDYFDLLENFKFGLEFYLGYFFAFLIFGFSCFYLIRSNLIGNRIYSRQTNASKFIYFISYLFISRKFKFKLILLFLALFSWFTLLFVTNTIKTNKVVDTSELIKNRDELMKSELVCFFKDDTAYNLALNSDKNSLLFKLFDQKTKAKDKGYEKEKLVFKSDRCYLQHSPEYLKLLRKNIEIIMSQIEFMGMMFVASTLSSLKKVFVLNKGIQEYNAVIYYLKYKPIYNVGLDFKKYIQVAHKFSYSINENGVNLQLYNCMESNTEAVFRKTISVYQEVYQYVEDNTRKFTDLELDNFSSLFIIYFGFLTIIFIVFFIFQIAPFYYSKLINFIKY